MARAAMGAIVTDLRGSIGSLIFQRGSSGLIVHSKGSKTLSFNTRAVASRSYITTLQASWKSLTTTERSRWDAFSIFCGAHQKHNNNIALTGWQMFVRTNIPRLNYSIAILSVPLGSAHYPADCTFTIDSTVSPVLLRASRALDPASEFMIVQLSPPVLPTRKPNINLCKLVPIVTTAADNWDIETLYQTLYGITISSGMTITTIYTLADLVYGNILPSVIANQTF